MERVIYKNVYNYLVRNKLIYEYQSGHTLTEILLRVALNTINLNQSSNMKKKTKQMTEEYSK